MQGNTTLIESQPRILGQSLESLGVGNTPLLPLYYVKESTLPFIKFPHANPVLGPEMKSTGEAMGIGRTFPEAYAKAQIAVGNHLPTSGNVYLSAAPSYISKLPEIADKLNQLGFQVFSQNECVDQIADCVLVIAINDVADSNLSIAKNIRYAIENGICHATSWGAANAIIQAIQFQANNKFSIHSLQAKNPKHILTGEELTPHEITHLINKAIRLKKKRKNKQHLSSLSGHHLALLFSKPSLRTRFSFAIAMRELGGDVLESVETTRKTETPEDQAGVLSGYCDAVMVRTHDDSNLEKMTKTASIPIINGLSALHHPCQILADLMTLQEIYGSLVGLTLCYLGDGNNILHSFLLLAPQMGVNINYCCPKTRDPDAAILAASVKKAGIGTINFFSSPEDAVKDAHAVYTDVWTSMGFESDNDDMFAGFQVNEALMQHASQDAIFMHCLPMERGKEVSETLPEQACSVIYQQSENRLHIQKALLLYLLNNEEYQHV